MIKINQLIKEWPRGAIMTPGYLKEKGISRELIKRYRKSGWIERIGRGAYKIAGDNVGWEGGLYTLQQQLELKVHVGARTGLELKGFGHFLGPELRTVYLFGQPGIQLPTWFRKYNWTVDILYTATNLFPEKFQDSLTNYKYKNFNLKMSNPERAALEMLYHVPIKQGFSESFHIIKSLSTLRSDIIQNLLENCRSIKVKRLFLYMSEQHNYFWFNDLDLDRIDLGMGKRVIIKSGAFNKKYQITVPRVMQD